MATNFGEEVEIERKRIEVAVFALFPVKWNTKKVDARRRKTFKARLYASNHGYGF